jgi:hypothetical protein
MYSARLWRDMFKLGCLVDFFAQTVRHLVFSSGIVYKFVRKMGDSKRGVFFNDMNLVIADCLLLILLLSILLIVFVIICSCSHRCSYKLKEG